MIPQIIELDGRPAFAVVPMDQWQALLERIEELEDMVDACAASHEETLPLDMVERLLAGESAVAVWRRYRGLSVEELARGAGCPPQLVAAVESHAVPPDGELLVRLAAVLRCDPDDLVAS